MIITCWKQDFSSRQIGIRNDRGGYFNRDSKWQGAFEGIWDERRNVHDYFDWNDAGFSVILL